MTSGPPTNTEKILVRGVNWLGDAIMSAPALQRLRLARPNARITLLTPAKLAGLWESQPFLDEVISFPANKSSLELARGLREKNFSTGIAFPNSIRSAMELWLAKIPTRVGRTRPLRGLFLTDSIPARAGAVPMRKLADDEVRRRVAENTAPIPISAAAHHIYDYLDLLAAIGIHGDVLPPRIAVSERQLEKFRERLAAEGLTGRQPLFGLNPGAEYGPAKRWPAERFVSAAVELAKKTNCRWLIFGGTTDVPLAETIAAQIRSATGDAKSALNLAGKTTLGELAAAIKLCKVVLTNDTGPMHLAYAVGTPLAVIFGSTSPELTGPWPAAPAKIIRAGAPCSPCFRRQCPIDLRCLTSIAPQTVVAAVLELSAQAPAQPKSP
jgi:heptosyltransferase II